jgi:hypothetical protein
MAINPNIPKTVNAGEPVTAEGWNVIVKGIIALTDYLNSTEASSLKVSLTNVALELGSARVTATRADGTNFEAVAPIPPAAEFVFSGLAPGAYTIRAEAPGFDPATKAVTAPSAQPVSLTLTPHGAFMPVVFGSTLQAALTQLKNVNIAVSRVLDVTGRDIAPANPGAANNDSPVLAQIPGAGVPVPPDGSAQLVVATSLQIQSSIEIPSLAGLTLIEAKTALEHLGLSLGKVVTKSKS